MSDPLPHSGRRMSGADSGGVQVNGAASGGVQVIRSNRLEAEEESRLRKGSQG